MNVHLSMTVLYSSLTNSPMPLAYSSLMNLLSSLTHPLLSLMALPSLTVPYLSLTNSSMPPAYSSLMNSSLTNSVMPPAYSSLMNLQGRIKVLSGTDRMSETSLEACKDARVQQDESCHSLLVLAPI